MRTFKHDIDRFLRTGEGDFDRLALELFAYQFELNKPYRVYCEAQGLKPSLIQGWQDIPAVPINAFKSSDLVTFPIGQAAAVFQSSGTTRQTPSRHYLKTLTYYESALTRSFEEWVMHEGFSGPFLILAPPPAEAPRSSLSWMMDVVKRTRGGLGSDYFIQRGRLDEPSLIKALQKAEETHQPVVLLGTTIAFLAFVDYLAKRHTAFALPRDSRIMDTGGMKSQKREITRQEFVRQVGEFLGISENNCINEYGMCELGSQFYGRGVSLFLLGPRWTRTLVIDPLSGRPAQPGMPGLLRHFDLANVDSVMAIQTEDVGVAEKDGFIFLGRDPSAEMKGCSIAAESVLR